MFGRKKLSTQRKIRTHNKKVKVLGVFRNQAGKKTYNRKVNTSKKGKLNINKFIAVDALIIRAVVEDILLERSHYRFKSPPAERIQTACE